MTQITHKETRILYVMAKNGGPVRGRVISHATGRWPGAERKAVLKSLLDQELIEKQTTPGKQGARGGEFFWLTEAGLDAVFVLIGAGEVKLPDNWRQQYGTERAT